MAAGLIAAGLLVFGNSLWGPFVYDDVSAILNNPHIQRLWPLRDAIGAPANTAVAGFDVRGYHAVNIALHLLCALTLFGVVPGLGQQGSHGHGADRRLDPRCRVPVGVDPCRPRSASPAPRRIGVEFRSPEELWRSVVAHRPSARAFNNLALVVAADGRRTEAIGYYREALGLSSDHLEARFNLANSLCLQGELAECVTQYLEYLRRNPGDADVHALLGIALDRDHRPAEALAHYREAVRLNPDSVETHANLAQALLAAGESTEAAEHYRRYLRDRPDDAAVENSLGTASPCRIR